MCTPKCLADWELKPCYCNHWNPLLADRNIHRDPFIMEHRTGCTGRFLSSATCSQKVYSLHAMLKLSTMFTTNNVHMVTQRYVMLFFGCLTLLKPNQIFLLHTFLKLSMWLYQFFFPSSRSDQMYSAYSMSATI